MIKLRNNASIYALKLKTTYYYCYHTGCQLKPKLCLNSRYRAFLDLLCINGKPCTKLSVRTIKMVNSITVNRQNNQIGNVSKKYISCIVVYKNLQWGSPYYTLVYTVWELIVDPGYIKSKLGIRKMYQTLSENRCRLSAWGLGLIEIRSSM